MRVKPLAYAVAAISAATANSTWGAEEGEQQQVQQLDAVMVSASRVKESVASIPYTTQIIEGNSIAEQAQPGQDLGQILGQLVPGLAPGDNSANSAYQTLRGRKVLVLIDGVAQRASRDISRQLTTISPENIERVEVISGATAVYGAGATGGVINIITKRGVDQETQFNSKVGMTLNTENTDSDGFTYFGSQSISGLVGDVDYLFNINYEQRGNFYDSEGDQIATDPNQVSRDNSDTLDVLLNLGWQINDTQSLRVGLEHFREKQDTDYAADFGDPSAAYLGLPEGIFAAGGDYTPRPQKGLNLDQQPETSRDSITLDFNDQAFFGHTLLTQLSYRENEYYYYPYPSSPLFLSIDWAGVTNDLLGGASQTQALVNNLNGATGTLFQSRVNSEVLDFKLALDKQLELDASTLDLTYGVDYTHDNSEQKSIEYRYDDWVASGQTQYNTTGEEYDAGPASTTQTSALFLQGKLALDQHWTFKAGVRYEHAEVEVDDTISGVDIANADYYQQELQDTDLQTLAALAGAPSTSFFLANVINSASSSFGYENYLIYSDTAPEREGGKETYSETLFNAGVVYAFNPQQETFLNYSEGFTVPDMTRLLRSVTVLSDGGNSGPILEGTNIDATKTKSWDLGWRGRFDNITAQTSLFYNTSDQNVEFDRETGVVVIRKQDERFYGFEAMLDARFDNGAIAGFTYARTVGETKNDEGDWYALGADRVSPEKLTGYFGYSWSDAADARLQFTHLSDYKKGNQEAPADRRDQVVPFEGYRTFDLITNFYTSAGDFSVALRNLTNAEYYSVYNQVRGYPQGGASAYLPAQGRTLSLSYSLDY